MQNGTNYNLEMEKNEFKIEINSKIYLSHGRHLGDDGQVVDDEGDLIFLVASQGLSVTCKKKSSNYNTVLLNHMVSRISKNWQLIAYSQTKFLYWAKLVDSVTRLQLPA